MSTAHTVSLMQVLTFLKKYLQKYLVLDLYFKFLVFTFTFLLPVMHMVLIHLSFLDFLLAFAFFYLLDLIIRAVWFFIIIIIFTFITLTCFFIIILRWFCFLFVIFFWCFIWIILIFLIWIRRKKFIFSWSRIGRNISFID